MNKEETNLKQKYQKSFNEAYEMLNDEQREAVDTIEGPVCVVAGPGTGKTQILTLRIANILKTQGGSFAENILALTFTNAGVYAMRQRLAEFVGIETAYKVGIFTFHSFAEEMIKTNPEIFSRFTFSRPITDIEKIKIIENILNKTKWKYLQTFASDFHYTKKIISAIDDLKSDAISPSDLEASILTLEKRILEQEGENAFYKRKCAGGEKGDIKKDILNKIQKQKDKQKELVKIYQAYQDELRKQKLYDFSDMILSVVQEAEDNKEFRAILQEKFLYLLVDEHQDTNDAQGRMIEAIAESKVNEGRPNLFTVGDEKQAIYRFQGASLENFQKFRNKYKDVKVINLKNNYRSIQSILDPAHSLITGEVELQAFKKSENKKAVKVSEFQDYKEELIFIAEDIQGKIKNGKDPNEIAIFYKENASLGEIKSILEKSKIPYKVKSKENILDSKDIQKLIFLLKAVENPLNDENLAKVLFIDFLDFGTHDVLKILEKLANRKGKEPKHKSILKLISSEEILKSIDILDPQKFVDFSEFLKDQKKLSFEKDFLEFFESFINGSGFLKYILQKSNNTSALKRLEKIFDEAKKQFFTKKDYSLTDFLDYINILKQYNISIDLGENDLIDGVNLMTAHGSKGLEFEDVYITNFIDSKWGGTRKRGQDFVLDTSKTAGDIDDERRLFYVALTRGKENVQITFSKFDLEGREKIPSRFLEEIGEDFLIFEKPESLGVAKKIEKYFGKKEEKVLSIFDKEYIKKLFLQNTLSVSALNNYKQSPIKYFFRNLIRIPSAQTKPLIFGNIIHDTFDVFFKEKGKRDILEIFDESVQKFTIPEKYFDDIVAHGKELLENYVKEYKDSFEFNVQTEKRMSAGLELQNEETLRLYGIVDKMEMLDGGKIRVVDYKTGKSYSQKTKDQKADLERQLIFYKLLIDKFYDDNRVEEGLLDFVEINKKTEKYERQKRVITAKEVAELEQEIQDFAEDILSGAFLDREYEKTKENEDFWDLWELLKR